MNKQKRFKLVVLFYILEIIIYNPYLSLKFSITTDQFSKFSYEKKQKRLKSDDKLAVIAYHNTNPNKSHNSIKEYFMLHKSLIIPKSTIGYILRNKEDIISNAEKGVLWKRDDVIDEEEDKLARLIRKAENDNLPINTDIITMKARELASERNYEKCKFSNGWIQRFKKHHSINMQKSYGDAKRIN